MNTTSTQTRVSLFFLIVILYGDLNGSRKFIQRATMTQLQKKVMYEQSIKMLLLLSMYVQLGEYLTSTITESESVVDFQVWPSLGSNNCCATRHKLPIIVVSPFFPLPLDGGTTSTTHW